MDEPASPTGVMLSAIGVGVWLSFDDEQDEEAP